MEIWKPIENFEHSYQISNFGRIKSLPRKVIYRDGRIRSYNEKILNLRIDPKGYYFISLYKNTILIQERIHRLVAKAFIPNPENKPCVNHLDSDRLNNNLINLEWCTYSENTKHGVKQGNIKNPAKKITEEIVLEIRNYNKNNKITQDKLGDMFNLSQTQISRIINFKNWK